MFRLVHLFSAFLSKEACAGFQSCGAQRVSLGLQVHTRYRRFQSVILSLQDLRGQANHDRGTRSFCLLLGSTDNMSSAPRICVQHLKALRLCSTSYRIVIRSTAPCPFLLVNSVPLVKKAKTYDNSDMLTFRWRGVRKSSPVLQGSLGVPTNYSLHPCVHLTRKIGSTSRVMPARDLRSHCYDHLL